MVKRSHFALVDALFAAPAPTRQTLTAGVDGIGTFAAAAGLSTFTDVLTERTRAQRMTFALVSGLFSAPTPARQTLTAGVDGIGTFAAAAGLSTFTEVIFAIAARRGPAVLTCPVGRARPQEAARI